MRRKKQFEHPTKLTSAQRAAIELRAVDALFKLTHCEVKLSNRKSSFSTRVLFRAPGGLWRRAVLCFGGDHFARANHIINRYRAREAYDEGMAARMVG